MKHMEGVEVAVLLATYNGAPFLEQQIRSLKENDTRFTLHWLDDHSADNSREIVSGVAENAGIALREWHQPQHEGLPGAFFRLLECVKADIYLFCDQDDIWQSGKIDATVTNLMPELDSPVICFSDPLAFRNDNPENCYRMLDVARAKPEAAMKEARVFTPVVGYGHTEGFTRTLREIFMRHNDIARAHAFMHDMWMYAIAVASGSARFMSDVPTTLYRVHGRSTSWDNCGWGGSGSGRITFTWQQHQTSRRSLSRHAEGFIRASPTLPPGPKLDRLLETARLVAMLDRRQSPAALVRLVRRGILWPDRRLALWLALNCLCSDATA
jgi:hypothetical protein